jgi:hypothetical protein
MVTRSLILALALALAACAGPSPVVDHVAVAPSPVPGHMRVTGTLTNHGGGGTVELVITLHGAATVRDQETLALDDHQRVDLAIDVAAPPGNYTADVLAQYPN